MTSCMVLSNDKHSTMEHNFLVRASLFCAVVAYSAAAAAARPVAQIEEALIASPSNTAFLSTKLAFSPSPLPSW